VIRPARAEDRDAIAAIQRSCPDAAQWDPAGYDVSVAELESQVVGFLVTRLVADGEVEVLNLAVSPDYRRRGVAKALLGPLLNTVHGDVFLEVREANFAARKFYQALGFIEVSRRSAYYEDPPDTGIVMNFHSC
jgi:ribosomal-protein-alanine N-acetyltransferase